MSVFEDQLVSLADEIKILFERKNGLLELFKSLQDSSHPLYDRIVQDMGMTSTKFHAWWTEKGRQYKWEGRRAIMGRSPSKPARSS